MENFILNLPPHRIPHSLTHTHTHTHTARRGGGGGVTRRYPTVTVGEFLMAPPSDRIGRKNVKHESSLRENHILIHCPLYFHQQQHFSKVLPPPPRAWPTYTQTAGRTKWHFFHSKRCPKGHNKIDVKGEGITQVWHQWRALCIVWVLMLSLSQVGYCICIVSPTLNFVLSKDSVCAFCVKIYEGFVDDLPLRPRYESSSEPFVLPTIFSVIYRGGGCLVFIGKSFTECIFKKK